MAEKPKKQKATKAVDGLIKPEFIQEAQQSTMHFGVARTLRAIQIIEPELVGFIAAVAKDLAAHAMIDFDIPQAAALQLKQQIVALGFNVFQAQHLAVYSYYKDIIRGTPVDSLDAEPFPTPAKADEGGACGDK